MGGAGNKKQGRTGWGGVRTFGYGIEQGNTVKESGSLERELLWELKFLAAGLAGNIHGMLNGWTLAVIWSLGAGTLNAR